MNENLKLPVSIWRIVPICYYRNISAVENIYNHLYNHCYEGVPYKSDLLGFMGGLIPGHASAKVASSVIAVLDFLRLV